MSQTDTEAGKAYGKVWVRSIGIHLRSGPDIYSTSATVKVANTTVNGWALAPRDNIALGAVRKSGNLTNWIRKVPTSRMPSNGIWNRNEISVTGRSLANLELKAAKGIVQTPLKRGSAYSRVGLKKNHRKSQYHRWHEGYFDAAFHDACRLVGERPKLSDRRVRRGTLMVGGKAAVEAGAVMHGAVRCNA